MIQENRHGMPSALIIVGAEVTLFDLYCLCAIWLKELVCVTRVSSSCQAFDTRRLLEQRMNNYYKARSGGSFQFHFDY